MYALLLTTSSPLLSACEYWAQEDNIRALFLLNLRRCQVGHPQLATQDLHVFKANPLGSGRPSSSNPSIAFVHDIGVDAVANTVVNIAVIEAGVGGILNPPPCLVVARVGYVRQVPGGLEVSALVPIKGYVVGVNNGNTLRSGQWIGDGPYDGGCRKDGRDKRLARSVTAKTNGLGIRILTTMVISLQEFCRSFL